MEHICNGRDKFNVIPLLVSRYLQQADAKLLGDYFEIQLIYIL